MKDLWKSGILILLIIGIVYVLYLRECKHPIPCPPEGQVLVPEATWDSILALANKPPKVTIDTQWIEKPIVTPLQPPMPKPKPDIQDTTANEYADSLINKEINVHYDFKVRGILLTRKWSYRPTTTEIRIDSTVYVPYPVEVEKPVPQAVNSLYGNIVLGGNKAAFIFGGGLDLTTKKGTEIGYQYQRFGKENFHSIKIGSKLFKKR